MTQKKQSETPKNSTLTHFKPQNSHLYKFFRGVALTMLILLIVLGLVFLTGVGLSEGATPTDNLENKTVVNSTNTTTTQNTQTDRARTVKPIQTESSDADDESNQSEDEPIVGVIDRYARLSDVQQSQGKITLTIISSAISRLGIYDLSGQSGGQVSGRSVTVPPGDSIKINVSVSDPSNPSILISSPDGAYWYNSGGDSITDRQTEWEDVGAAAVGGLFAGTIPTLYLGIKKRREAKKEIERVV